MVRLTESRLPPGYLPEDLGQIAMTEENDSYLISYLTSPIRRGVINTYVLFIVDSSLADKVASYTWSVTLADLRDEWVDNKCAGIFRYAFEAATDVFGDTTTTILVKLNDDEGNLLRQLTLQQEIIAPNASLEKIFRQTKFSDELDYVLQRIAFGGHPSTTREVVNDFGLYINMAFEKFKDQSPYSDYLIPKQMLAAITYLSVMAVPEKKRNSILEDAAKELNSTGIPGVFYRIIADLPKPLGVCQISPQMAALVANKLPSSGDFEGYLEWREFSGNENMWGNYQKKLMSEFEDLSKEDKVDLLNLVRFPKSNIQICYGLLLKLKQREHRYNQMSAEQFLGDENAIKVISNELKIGPVSNQKTHKALTSGKFGSKVVDTMLAPYLVIEFDGQLKIEGQVKDQDNSYIENAHVKIFATKAIVETNNLKVFRDPNISKSNFIEIHVPDNTTIELPVLDVRRSVTVDGNFSEGDNDLVKVVLESDVLDVNTGWLVLRSRDTWYGYLDSSSHTEITNEQGYFSTLVRELQPYFIRVSSADCEFKDFESEKIFPLTEGWFIPPEKIDISVERESGLVREADILDDLSSFHNFEYSLANGGYPANLAFGTSNNIFGISSSLFFPIDAVTKVCNCTTFTEGLLFNAWMKLPHPTVFYTRLETELKSQPQDSTIHLDELRVPAEGMIGIKLSLKIEDNHIITSEILEIDTNSNTITLEEAVANGADVGTAVYIPSDHDLWMPLHIAPDWYGSITVARARDMAWNNVLDGSYFPEPWTLVQAWRKEPPGPGHSFIVLDSHKRSKRVLILESNVGLLNGPGFRGIGHIDQEQVDTKITPNKDKPWHQKKVPIWSELFGTQSNKWKTDHTRMVQLKVCDLQIARRPTL